MWEIKKELEERKENLIYLLKNKKDFLELEKQHQIYGAIKELDHVLNIIESCREAEMAEKPRQMDFTSADKSVDTGSGIESSARLLTRTKKRIKKFSSPIKFRLAKNDA